MNSSYWQEEVTCTTHLACAVFYFILNLGRKKINDLDIGLCTALACSLIGLTAFIIFWMKTEQLAQQSKSNNTKSSNSPSQADGESVVYDRRSVPAASVEEQHSSNTDGRSAYYVDVNTIIVSDDLNEGIYGFLSPTV